MLFVPSSVRMPSPFTFSNSNFFPLSFNLPSLTPSFPLAVFSHNFLLSPLILTLSFLPLPSTAGWPDGQGGDEVSGSDRFQPQLWEPDSGWKHSGVHRSHRAAGRHRQGAAGGGETHLQFTDTKTHAICFLVCIKSSEVCFFFHSSAALCVQF